MFSLVALRFSHFFCWFEHATAQFRLKSLRIVGKLLIPASRFLFRKLAATLSTLLRRTVWAQPVSISIEYFFKTPEIMIKQKEEIKVVTS